MPVFDFNHMPDEKNDQAVCTYTTFLSSESEASPEQPILILDNRERKWAHHSCGIFTNPVKRTSFEFKEEDGVAAADIRKLDARFVSLLKWLGENHIPVRLSGETSLERATARFRLAQRRIWSGRVFPAQVIKSVMLCRLVSFMSSPSSSCPSSPASSAGAGLTNSLSIINCRNPSSADSLVPPPKAISRIR